VSFNSTLIGENLKGIGPNIRLGGAGALIYMPKTAAESVQIIGASAAVSCPWMPYLDEGMDDEEQVY
jgi:hypothetical protein